MFTLLPIVRALHELLWYLAEVQERAAPARDTARAAIDRITRLTRRPHDVLRAVDVAAERTAVDPLLRRASALVRVPHRSRPPARGTLGPGAVLARRDLAGADLRAARLPGADLRGALLIGANLRDADLRDADLIGADLRASDLRGADLTGALFLTRAQLQSAVGDAATRIPARLVRPAHWGSARKEVEQQ
jgi:hypothetical protein